MSNDDFVPGSAFDPNTIHEGNRQVIEEFALQAASLLAHSQVIICSCCTHVEQRVIYHASIP